MITEALAQFKERTDTDKSCGGCYFANLVESNRSRVTCQIVKKEHSAGAVCAHHQPLITEAIYEEKVQL